MLAFDSLLVTMSATAVVSMVTADMPRVFVLRGLGTILGLAAFEEG